MKIEGLLDSLMGDLTNEYAHWHFYMQASTSVVGLHRQEISEFFLEQAAGEMKHVEEFRRMIQGVMTRRGIEKKIPSLPAEFRQGLSSPEDLLSAALEMEDRVVKNYVARRQEAEEVCEERADLEDVVDATYISLFLEDQIIDSRADADNIREMLKNIVDIDR
jgi:ferritin